MATELFGVANLLDELDKRVICTLRDGITFVGVLRTVDEFGNIVLHNAVERITIDRQYGEQDRGIVLVRGDNISMLGELGDETQMRATLQEVDFPDMVLLRDVEREKQRAKQPRIQRHRHDDAYVV
eukprot:m.86855 g.86855  ORF g.86855 m.86855 type:complete len:126 (+) comp12817_c0_seq3:167-544(+)